MALTGPGDDDSIRLVMAYSVTRASMMKVETGETPEVIFIDIASRSLASAEELMAQSFGFSPQQLITLRAKIDEVLG